MAFNDPRVGSWERKLKRYGRKRTLPHDGTGPHRRTLPRPAGPSRRPLNG